MTMTTEEAATAPREDLVAEFTRASEALAARKNEILLAVEGFAARQRWARHVTDALIDQGGLKPEKNQQAPTNPEFFTDEGLRAQLELRRADTAAAEELTRKAIGTLAWQGYYNLTRANALLAEAGLRQITETRTWNVTFRPASARWTTRTEPDRTRATVNRLRTAMTDALKAVLGDDAGDVTWAGTPELMSNSTGAWDVDGIVY